jgi:hypothetical protein
MIEASVADLPGGVDGSKGYEIYILMEWCAGKQLFANFFRHISRTHVSAYNDSYRRRNYRYDEYPIAEPNDGE